MPTPVWLTGFEYGLATPVALGGGLFNTVSGTMAIQGAVKRTGDYALQINTTAGAAIVYGYKTAASGQAIVVGRVYVRYATLPNARANIVGIQAAAGKGLNIEFSTTGNKFASSFAGTNIVLSNVVVSTDTWYRIDFKFDMSGGTQTIDYQITPDAGSTTTVAQNTYDQAATTATNIIVGWPQSVTANIFYDDLYFSVTALDYPIGAGNIVGLRPNVDGTHNNAANIMEDSAGNDIHATNFPAYSYLDENPWTSTADADYVRQTANGTGNYAEILFADTAENNIHGAMALLEYASASTTGNNGGCIIIDEDATARTLYGAPGALADYSETSAYYKSIVIPAPAGGWDTAAVNALKCRMGYSGDAAPDPYWLAIMLEVAYGPTQIVVAAATHGHVADGSLELAEESSGVTLTVADGVQANTAGAPVLTQVHGLSPAASAHALASDVPTLAQVHTLAVAAGGHAHAADAVVLGGNTLLVVSDCSHSHTANQSGPPATGIPDIGAYEYQPEDLILEHGHRAVAADGVHALTSDAPVLAQAHGLSVADAAHGLASGAPVLAQAHALTVANSEHAHGAEAPSLTQAHVLAPTDGSHALMSDAPVLTQAHTLDVDNAAHSPDSPNVTLGASVALVVAESVHTHRALQAEANYTGIPDIGAYEYTPPELTLEQAHVLAVADGIHAHEAASPNLSGAALLEVADSVHVQEAGAPALTQAHVIAPEASAHALVSDAPTLAQAHALAVSDGVHAVGSDSPELDEEAGLIALTVQAAAHAHEAGAVIVTQAHILTAADALNAHTAGSVSLSQVHVLSLLDSLHGHIVDPVILSQAHTLAVSDGGHSMTSDIPLPSTKPVELVVQAGQHVHQAAGITLAQAHMLIALASVHAVTSDAVIVSTVVKPGTPIDSWVSRFGKHKIARSKRMKPGMKGRRWFSLD